MPGLSFEEARFPWSRRRNDRVAGPEKRKREKAIGTRTTLFGARIFERCGTYALLSLSAYVGLHPALSAGGSFLLAWIRFYLSIIEDDRKNCNVVRLPEVKGSLGDGTGRRGADSGCSFEAKKFFVARGLGNSIGE